MKASLRPGVSRTKRIAIDRDRTIGFMGEEARVYATPRLVSDIEYTCRELILEHADAGEELVGTEIGIQHLAATLLGSTVEITVSVAAVEGRRVAFEVSARDELEEISKGTHGRFVVEVEKTIARLKAKAAKRDALVVESMTVADEPLILVDSRNRPVGSAGKTAVHRAGLLHRAFSIFVVDARGRVLLQRRSAKKYHSGGLWANSCCGHPRPGERTLAAARRRLYEELGVTSPLTFGFFALLSGRADHGMQENEFVYVYLGRSPRRCGRTRRKFPRWSS